jgi:hypothetical protein
MPTRETHPIDDLFRRKLADMEAPPPPQVWEGIMNARRERRWLPPWFRMNGLLLVLIPAAMLVTYLSWPVDNDAAGAEGQTYHAVPVSALGQQNVNSAGVSSISPAMGNNESGGGPDQAGTTSRTPGASTSSPVAFEGERETSTALGHTSTIPNQPPTTELTASREAVSAMSLADDRNRDEPVLALPAASDLLMDAGNANFLRPLPIQYTGTLTRPSIVIAEIPPPYVLPPAEWVISLVAGRYDVGRRWRGQDDALSTALNNSEARTTSHAFGMTIGRHWHSGFGITTGILAERSEQQFQFLDSRTEVSREVIPYIVTLNSQVFVSDTDTIDHYSTTEKFYEGINRRTVVRIPVEGHYIRRVGRFHYGVRAGFALEYTSAQQDHSLSLDHNEGRIGVTKLSGNDLRRRYPLMLLATSGLDLGYTLGEQWSIGLNPMYMAGAMPLSPAGEAWNSPSRLGLQFRLSHHLSPKKIR